jgi:hypothetical protein
MPRFERGYARISVSLVLNRSEHDRMRSIFEQLEQRSNSDRELAEYVLSRLSAAKER